MNALHSHKTGFTLIELLVSIAIALILIALIFAGGARAIASGKVVKCVQNMRQIGFAMNQYLTENDGRFPDTWPVSLSSWDMRIMPYLDNSGYDFPGFVGSPTGIGTNVPLSAAKIFQCPEDDLPRSAGNYTRSYSLSSWTANVGGWYSASLPADTGIRIHQLQAPARTALLIECPVPRPFDTTGNILGKSNLALQPPTYTWSDIHSQKSNILFADFHIELIPRTKSTPINPTFYARYFPPESRLCIAAGGPLPQ